MRTTCAGRHSLRFSRRLSPEPPDCAQRVDGSRSPHVRFLLILVAATFLLAGFVKGALGLGLPTVSMGLLAVSMPPAQAIAIVIVPAIVTNIWQTFGGPYLRDIFRRLWPLLAATAAGVWLNAVSLTGPYARYTTIALGLLLAINAIIGLSKFNFTVAPETKNGSAASSG